MYRKLSCLAVAILVCGCEDIKPAAEPEAAAPEPIVAQKAEAGVGKQGQIIAKHNDYQKIISGPASVLFKARQWGALEVQVPQALQLFQALEGRMPKDHAEFMSKIVEANRIQLPELPAGAVYHFNTEKGELWVYPEAEVPAN